MSIRENIDTELTQEQATKSTINKRVLSEYQLDALDKITNKKMRQDLEDFFLGKGIYDFEHTNSQEDTNDINNNIYKEETNDNDDELNNSIDSILEEEIPKSMQDTLFEEVGNKIDSNSIIEIYNHLSDQLTDDQKNMSIKFNPFQPKNYKNLLNNIRHLYKTIQENLNYYEENKDYNVKASLLNRIWKILPEHLSPTHTTGNIIQDLYMYLDELKEDPHNIKEQIEGLFPDEIETLTEDKRQEYKKAYEDIKHALYYQVITPKVKDATNRALESLYNRYKTHSIALESSHAEYIERSKNINIELRKKIYELEYQNDQLENEIDNFKRDKKNLQENNTELEEANKALKEDKKQLKEDNEMLQTEINSTRNGNELTEHIHNEEKIELQEQITELQEEFEDEKERFEEQMKELQEKIKELSKENKNLYKENTELLKKTPNKSTEENLNKMIDEEFPDIAPPVDKNKLGKENSASNLKEKINDTHNNIKNHIKDELDNVHHELLEHENQELKEENKELRETMDNILKKFNQLEKKHEFALNLNTKLIKEATSNNNKNENSSEFIKKTQTNNKIIIKDLDTQEKSILYRLEKRKEKNKKYGIDINNKENSLKFNKESFERTQTNDQTNNKNLKKSFSEKKVKHNLGIQQKATHEIRENSNNGRV